MTFSVALRVTQRQASNATVTADAMTAFSVASASCAILSFNNVLASLAQFQKFRRPHVLVHLVPWHTQSLKCKCILNGRQVSTMLPPLYFLPPNKLCTAHAYFCYQHILFLNFAIFAVTFHSSFSSPRKHPKISSPLITGAQLYFVVVLQH